MGLSCGAVLDVRLTNVGLVLEASYSFDSAVVYQEAE